jgi:hypothetical protein
MREAQLMIAFGMMGVGKTYVTEKLFPEYVKKLNRKVLIFDPNNEDTFHRYATVYFDIEDIMQTKKREAKEQRRIITKSEQYIKDLAPGQIRRVAPFTKYGESMNMAQLKQTMKTLCENLRGGLLFLEDVNRYVTNFESEELLGAFKTIRHHSLDLIMHMQSTNPIRPILFEAATCFRMHYDGFDVDKIKPRLGNRYEILKIAQLIVEQEYRNGNNRFFLYIQNKNSKISGINKKQFTDACKKYLTANPNEFASLAMETAFKNNRHKPSFSDKEKAIHEWIQQHMHYWDGK